MQSRKALVQTNNLLKTNTFKQSNTIKKPTPSKSSLKVAPSQSISAKVAAKPTKQNKPVARSSRKMSQIIQAGKLPSKNNLKIAEKLQTKVNLVQEIPLKDLSKKTKVIAQKPLSTQQQQLFPCGNCGRSFILASKLRHQKICKKIFTNKRKEFNSAKQRFNSKQQIALFKKGTQQQEKNKGKSLKAMPIWKQQSLAFRIAMKQVKGGAKTKQQIEFKGQQKKLQNANMFTCRICKRKFNEQAGQRHQQFCEKQAKDVAFKAKRK